MDIVFRVRVKKIICGFIIGLGGLGKSIVVNGTIRLNVVINLKLLKKAKNMNYNINFGIKYLYNVNIEEGIM